MVSKNKSKKQMPVGRTLIVEATASRMSVKPKGKKKKQKRSTVPSKCVMECMRTLVDPCGPIMSKDMNCTKEGVFRRFHRHIPISGTANNTSGYILWCPDYSGAHTVSGAYSEECIFAWADALSSAQPQNSSLYPYGSQPASSFASGALLPTAAHFRDPAGDFNALDLVADTRALSACMRLKFTGPALNMQGEYAVIKGFPLSELLRSNSISPCGPTVDELFEFAGETNNITKTPIEVRWRPSATSELFRPYTDGALHVGVSPNPTTMSESAETTTPCVFGIVWSGIDNSYGHPFVLDLVKNAESRLAPVTHTANTPPEHISETATKFEAAQTLDEVMPEWETITHDETFYERLSKWATSPLGRTIFRRAVGGILSGLRQPRNDMGYVRYHDGLRTVQPLSGNRIDLKSDTEAHTGPRESRPGSPNPGAASPPQGDSEYGSMSRPDTSGRWVHVRDL